MHSQLPCAHIFWSVFFAKFHFNVLRNDEITGFSNFHIVCLEIGEILTFRLQDDVIVACIEISICLKKELEKRHSHAKFHCNTLSNNWNTKGVGGGGSPQTYRFIRRLPCPIRVKPSQKCNVSLVSGWDECSLLELRRPATKLCVTALLVQDLSLTCKARSTFPK